MESRWEFTAPQFVDFAAMDLDDDLDEDKFFDVNNETRCNISSTDTNKCSEEEMIKAGMRRKRRG